MLTKVEKILAAQRILGSRDAGPKATCQAYEAIGETRDYQKPHPVNSDQLNMGSNPGLFAEWVDPDVSV
jgi:hypothetical protein